MLDNGPVVLSRRALHAILYLTDYLGMPDSFEDRSKWCWTADEDEESVGYSITLMIDAAGEPESLEIQTQPADSRLRQTVIGYCAINRIPWKTGGGPSSGGGDDAKVSRIRDFKRRIDR